MLLLSRSGVSISTADYSRGRMSPSAAGVAGKPRTQRPGKSADEATKDKGKDNMSGPTPSYQPVRQELPCDSDSEGVRAVISFVKYLQPRIDHRTMNTHFCNVTQYGTWSSETWRLRPSTLQAHTTRPSSRHSRTSRTTSPRRRRSSHCPHSSMVGSFNLSRWGQATSSSPRHLLL